jgi:hypothetical protein
VTRVTVGARTLWLPLEARRASWIAAAALLVYYVWSSSLDLSVYDSAELALVAVQGGLGHPPGQPLHTMLGWLLAHIPGLRPLVAVNLLSSVPAALTVLPVVSLAEGLSAEAPARAHARRPLSAAVVALAGAHALVWDAATRVEIYALAAFVILWALARLAAASTPRGFLAAGIAFGLGASVNPVIAAIAVLAVAPVVIARRPGVRLVGFAVAGGVIGLLPYLYVPLVGWRQDVLVWGAPTGGAALRRFLTAADFAPNMKITVAMVVHHVVEWIGWSFRWGVAPFVLAGLLGHALLGGGPRALGRWVAAAALGLTVLYLATNVVWRLDNPDYLGYLAAPWWLATAGVAGLVGAARTRWIAGGLAAIALGAVTLATPTPLGRTRRHDRLARSLAEGALAEAPPGAIMVLESDHWVFPLFYLQEAEAHRADVVVLAYGLTSSSWYWEHLHRRHPELVRVPLRGPGGQAERVRRFLAANPRPLLVERASVADRLAVQPCAVGWLARAGAACLGAVDAASGPTRVVEEELARLYEGSPPAEGVLAQVALDRGEALWRLGQARAAYAALLAGVPPSLRHRLRVPAELLGDAPPLTVPLPNWRIQTALGHPARNLLVAGELARAAGQAALAEQLERAAAGLGLPEAHLSLARLYEAAGRADLAAEERARASRPDSIPP